MLVQSELKDTYWGADGALRLFEQAQSKLLRNASRRDSTAMTSTGPNSDPNSGSVIPAASHGLETSSNNNFNQITPSVDDLLTFDLAFTEPADLHMFDMGYP